MMIKNVILLTKVSTKNLLESMNLISKSTGKFNKKSTYFWLLIIVMVAIGILSNYILSFLQQYGQTGIFLDVIFAMLLLIMFMQSIILSINVFYFSKDIEYFLPLPLRPMELMLSKFNTIMLVLYGTEAIFALIPLCLYGTTINLGIIYYPLLLIALLLLPILPTLIVSVLSLFLMQIMKFIKNKNVFQILITLLFIVIIVVAEIFYIKAVIEMPNDNEMNEEMLVNMQNVAKKINSSFLVVNPLISVLKDQNIWLNLIKVIGIYAIGFIILFFIGSKLYIKGVFKATQYSKKKVSKKIDIQSSVKITSPKVAYLKNEFRGLFRSPIFFMQGIFPVCMTMIALVFVIVFFKFNVIDKSQELVQSFSELKLNGEGASLILIACQIFFSFINISITSISRQGKNAVFMKYIPVNLYTQFLLKNVPQITFSTVFAIIIILMAKLLFPAIQLLDMLILFVISMIIGVLNSFLMMIVDIKRPNLDWNAEIEVIKQNENKLFQYVWSIVTVVILMYTKNLFADNFNLYIAYLVLFTIFTILLILVNVYVKKQIDKNKLFNKIGL